MIAVEWIWQGKRKLYFARAVTAAAVYVFMKYVLTLVMPFFLAFCIISFMQPLLRLLEERLHIKKRIMAVLLLLFAVGIFGGIVWYLAEKVCGQLGFLSKNAEIYRDTFHSFLRSCCQRVEQYTGFRAGRLEETALLYISRVMGEMKQTALDRLLNQSVLYAQFFIGAVGFLGMTLIAGILLAKDFRKIQSDMQKYKWYRAAEEVGTAIGKLAADYLKAQLLILSIIGGCCAAVLWLAGIQGGIWLGILAGILDALPFIGTGIVLIPTALLQLVQGNFGRCAAVAGLYSICVFLREFLEPKLIGKRVDSYPVVVLLAIYMGMKLYGLAGVVTGPLSFLLIREIWRKIPDFCGDD